MTKTYDVIVVGLGGIGSAALFHLAQRGIRVLGIEQFEVAHDRGSSHGQTRAIRKAYFEHPSYVPLLERAYENWRSLQEISSKELYVPCGLLEVGPPDGVLINGIEAACQTHPQLQVERITPNEMKHAFPGFHFPEGYEARFESDGGFLWVESCIEQFIDAAVNSGAELKLGTKVVQWEAGESAVRLTTDQGVFEGAKLVICGGAWSNQLLTSLGIPLQILRKHLHWYQVPKDAYPLEKGSPCFFYETPAGCYYGFPCLQSRPKQSIKVAEHSGGEWVKDPDHLERTIDQEEQKRVESFLSGFLTSATNQSTQHKACMYTMTPDEHFVVDKHPHFSSVVFAAGMSGHGFKFASVLGEALADLSIDGATRLPIDFLGVDRF